MAEQIIDDNALDGNWYDTMAGEDAARIEVLSQFETPEAFFNSHQQLANADWRAAFVPEDDPEGKAAAQIARYDTPLAYGDAWREQRHTISSGKMQDELPAADADEADIATYREANGIPKEALDYLKDLPDGLVVGDEDAGIAEVFMNALHSVHADPRVAHALLSQYNSFAEEQQETQAALDVEQAKAATDELRDAWKGDYRININMANKFLTRAFGADVMAQLKDGRLADGRAFMNDSKVVQGMAAMERIIDPLSTMIDGGADPAQSLNDEIAELEKFMREHRTAYNADEVKSGRLRQLYGMRIKHEEQQQQA